MGEVRLNNSAQINVLKVLATVLVYCCHSWIVCHETFDLALRGWERLFITPAWLGVWIFLILGGYLASYGFSSGKYSLDKKGLLSYYRGRVVKILIPAWIFMFMHYVLVYPDVTIDIKSILAAVSFTFFGSADVYMPGIGASWYIFIVFWLYLLAPVVYSYFFRLEKKWRGKELSLYFILLAGIGLSGFLWRVSGYLFSWDWYKWTYASVPGCADLFFAGMCVCRASMFAPELKEETRKRWIWVLLFLLAALIGYCMDFGWLPYGGLIYPYVCPTICLFLTCSYLLLSNFERPNNQRSGGIGDFMRICNIAAPYTFMFYLWHSSILYYIVPKIHLELPFQRFLTTFFIGILMTSVMAFLMTEMNKGVIKVLLKK